VEDKVARMGIHRESVENSARLNLQPHLTKFQLAVTRQIESPSEESEKQLCLTSRSAYFAFFDWAVLHDQVDPVIEDELRNLFREAVAVMRVDRFKESVKERYKDLELLYERMHSGAKVDSLTSLT
jgi:hypothetical protein